MGHCQDLLYQEKEGLCGQKLKAWSLGSRTLLAMGPRQVTSLLRLLSVSKGVNSTANTYETTQQSAAQLGCAW